MQPIMGRRRSVLYYLSFATPAGWLGGGFTRADTITEAILRASRLGWNPGGEVLGRCWTAESAPQIAPDDMDRLFRSRIVIRFQSRSVANMLLSAQDRASTPQSNYWLSPVAADGLTFEVGATTVSKLCETKADFKKVFAEMVNGWRYGRTVWQSIAYFPRGYSVPGAIRDEAVDLRYGSSRYTLGTVRIEAVVAGVPA